METFNRSGDELKTKSRYIGDISVVDANQLVGELNEQIYAKIGFDTALVFEANYNGYEIVINWCGLQIWSSEDDDRPYINRGTEEEEPGDLKLYVINQIKMITNKINNIILE